jgi:hypothetical protein
MFCNRAELLPEDETVKEHETAKAEEAKSLAKDRAGRGLFQGIFSRRLPVGPLGRPRFIRDYEDNGILRCPFCAHEIVGGTCTNEDCQLADGTHSIFSDDIDYDSEFGDHFDDEASVNSIEGMAARWHTRPRHVDSQDEEDDEDIDEDDEHDSEMDDFIDRNEDYDEEDDHHSARAGPFRRLSSVSITNDSDSDVSIPTRDRHHYDHFSGDHVDTESDGYESGHVVHAAPRAYPINYDSESEQSFQSYPYPHSHGGSDTEQHTNYDSDGSSIREISPPVANHTRARRVVLDSDDEEGEGEDTEREDSPAPQFSEVESDSAADHSSPAGSVSEDNDIDSEDEDSDDTATLRPPQASNARYQRLQQHRYNRMRRASSSAEPVARPPARRANYQGGGSRSNVGLYPVVDLTESSPRRTAARVY